MRVILFGAGGPAGINFARSLSQASQHISVIGLDTNEEHLAWAERWCDRVYHHTPETLNETVSRLTDDETLLHSQPESGILWIHDNPSVAGVRFLPPRSVVLQTQDKFEAALQWRRGGLREDHVELVQDVLALFIAADRIGLPFWLRARHGAGARGSALITSVPQGSAWLNFWWATDPKMDFVAEEYLPGRDLAWESIWRDGALIASYLRHRTEYIYPHLAVSGKTGTPTVAHVIHDDAVNKQAVAAVREIDPEPHGIYSVDLVEDAEGIARPTEINAGRFFTTSYLSAMAGLSFPELYVRMAFGKSFPKDVTPFNSLPEGTYARHIDADAVWTPAESRVRPATATGLDERRLARAR